MFGIGMPELVVILVIALIVLGPKRLPEVARTLGKAMAEFRRQSSEIMDEFQAQVRLDEDAEQRARTKPRRRAATVPNTPATAATPESPAAPPRSRRPAAPDPVLRHAMGAEADVRMPLTAHLEELRTRLIRALLAVAAGFVVSYGFAEPLVAFLLRAAAPRSGRSRRSSSAPASPTRSSPSSRCRLVAGIFVASPAVFYQAWQFVAPGLYERERRVALPFSLAASFFFIAGAAFCYYLVFPVAFRFFLEEFTSVGIAPQIRVSEYLTFTSRMLLAFGVTFELPVVTFFLARIGLVTHRMMIGPRATPSS